MKRGNSKLSSSAVVVANEAFADKAKEIALVLSQPDVDLWRLRELAISEGGLVNGMCFVCFVCVKIAR